MAGSDSRSLTRAEQSYVAQVTYQLRHLPRQRQHHLLQKLRRRLLALMPYEGYARLEKDLGTPAAYAEWLVAGSRTEPDEEATAKRRWGRSRART